MLPRPHRLLVRCCVTQQQWNVILMPRRGYEAYRSGSYDMEQKKNREFENLSLMEKFKRNWQFIKEDSQFLKRLFKEMFVLNIASDPKRNFVWEDGQPIIYWDFNQANKDVISSYELAYKRDKYNDFNNCLVTCDSDYDVGSSKAFWTVSPAGKGLFSGYLDTTVPKDGKTNRSGYAFLSTYKCRLPFNFNASLEMLEEATHFVMRCRGDGRRYFVQLDTSTRLDHTWFDRFQYPVYTHGGPYWQYVKIPLTRFTFQYSGYLQDEQFTISPEKIKSVGFLATDSFSGPFRLEIDYIGFLRDSQHNDLTEYEGYHHESTVMKQIGSW